VAAAASQAGRREDGRLGDAVVANRGEVQAELAAPPLLALLPIATWARASGF